MGASPSKTTWWLSAVIIVLIAALAFQQYAIHVRQAVMIKQDVAMARATAYLLRHGETNFVIEVYEFIEKAGDSALPWIDWCSVKYAAYGQLGMEEHAFITGRKNAAQPKPDGDGLKPVP